MGVEIVRIWVIHTDVGGKQYEGHTNRENEIVKAKLGGG